MNGKITYTRCGDYYIPDLEAPKGIYEIGKYGRRHERFLKERHPCLYAALRTSGTLLKRLENVDKAAKAELARLMRLMAKEQGVTEKLKADDQLKWTGLMNNIRHCAEKMINESIIYTRRSF